MDKVFNLGGNLKVMVEITSNGVETTYCFIIDDKQKKQSGKVSITCNNFEKLSPSDLAKVDIAADKCDNSLEDWWTKYKELGDIEQAEKVRSLIPCAIAFFRDMQQNQGGKVLS